MQASHEQDPKQSRLTLSFEDPKLEVEFLHDLAMGLLKDLKARGSAVIGVIFLLGLGIYLYDEALRPLAFVNWLIIPYGLLLIRSIMNRLERHPPGRRNFFLLDATVFVGFFIYAMAISYLLIVDLGMDGESLASYQMISLILIAGHILNGFGQGRFLIGTTMGFTTALVYTGFASMSTMDQHQITMHVVLLGIITFTGALNAYQQEKMARHNFVLKKAVDSANEKAEHLLLNVLPGSIAARLKESSETIAESFGNATVLFADIVGFTVLSQAVSPTKLVELLNNLFSRFDDLTEKHGLEKIKTIGDAYMVAAGLPEEQSNHAQAIANMALDMRVVLEEFTESIGQPLQIRIGINSGPVVAGVIGKKKFIYDLWGDAVNTAARMESHGVPGEIQVTESTRNLLKVDYDLEPRGDIEVKGKGAMPVWLLKGRSAELGQVEDLSAANAYASGRRAERVRA